jgi:transcriptional regulator with XRE-family HTH domain
MNHERAALAKRLGRAIRSVREFAGLSQGEAERRAGLAPSALSQAENGLRTPSLCTLFKIADGLGVRPSALVAALEKAR